MSAATPSWFRQQLHPADCCRTVHFTGQPVLVPSPGHNHRVPADNPHNPRPQCQSWFSAAAPVQPSQQANHPPIGPAAPRQGTGPQPDMQSSCATGLSFSQYAAQAALPAPGPLLPVSQVMSRVPLPGSALQPSSPWKHTSPHIHPHIAPSMSSASVVIIPDRRQPTLAETLGFADSLQQSPSTGRQAFTLPVGTGSSQLHHMRTNIRAVEVAPQSAEAPYQARQAQAKGNSRQKAPQNSALSQPGVVQLVTQVEATFASQHTKFDAFLRLLHEYQASQIDKRQFETQVSTQEWSGTVLCII